MKKVHIRNQMQEPEQEKNENNIMHEGNPKKDDTACIVRVV